MLKIKSVFYNYESVNLITEINSQTLESIIESEPTEPRGRGRERGNSIGRARGGRGRGRAEIVSTHDAPPKRKANKCNCCFY